MQSPRRLELDAREGQKSCVKWKAELLYPCPTFVLFIYRAFSYLWSSVIRRHQNSSTNCVRRGYFVAFAPLIFETLKASY